MNLTHLRYLLEVEKTGSITKAAQNLYMGQPNLSKAIKDMEKDMGIVIFRRTAKGVEPTRKGMELLDYAKKLLSQVDEFESLFRSGSSPKLRFSVTVPRATYCSVAFSRFMNSLNDKDELNVDFREADAVTGINQTAAGEADLAVIRYQSLYEDYFTSLIKDKGLKSQMIHQFRMELLLSGSHPLAACSQVPYHMLTGFTEIRNGDYQLRTLAFSKIQREAELPAPARVINIYDRGSQYDLLTMTKGTYMWVSPPIEQEYLDRYGLVIRPCELSSETGKDVLVYLSGHKFNEFEKKFIAALKETAGKEASPQPQNEK